MKKNKRIKVIKILRKSQPNFWRYVKKIGTQAKNGFLIIKRALCKMKVSNFTISHTKRCFQCLPVAFVNSL